MVYRKRAWAEIQLDTLAHNASILEKSLPNETTLCAVVKADAYGHGEEWVCRRLYEDGIRFFAVSSFEEAIRVRRFCPRAEILILGYTTPECARELSLYRIIQTIVSPTHAKELSRCAKAQYPVRCHIAIDTGMGRIGLSGDTDMILAECNTIAELEGIEVEGLFTHFAVADELGTEGQDYTNHQYQKLVSIAEALPFSCKLHCMNSAGIAWHGDYHSAIARAGIILYGLNPNYSGGIATIEGLAPVLSLKSRIAHIKQVERGTSISYGRTYQTEEMDEWIATISIGYADGVSRSLSNQGCILVGGKRCPIVGRVCMDQLMVRLPEDIARTARVGDEVVLIGRQGDEEITADEMAACCQTIGYEIVCGISKRVPRVFFGNGGLVHEDSLI